MSQSTTTGTQGNSGIGKGIIKVIILAMLAIGIIGLPIALYEIGTLIAIHFATGDVEQGYAYGGLMSVIYNVTHVQQYNQMAQILPAQGTTEAVLDVSTIQTALLVFGLFLDGLLTYMGYVIYKHLEDY